MGRVYSSAHIEVYICSLFKKQTADKRSAVMLEAPGLVKFVVTKIILGIFKHLVNGYNAFGNKVYTLDFSNGRDIASFEIESSLNLFAEILCCNG